MLKRFLYSCIILLVASALVRCAKKGMPEGGPIDTIPPVFTKAIPENYNTYFDQKEIRIYFDEYIKLDNPQRQIIVSPPMDPKPEITPMGNASKYITIKIHDTLKENTTYNINFGKSIADNNEGNAFPFYNYVFSTGSYVDSLEISGTVTDAYQKDTDASISVMLYPKDTSYTDSVVYHHTPTYISYTKDSTHAFQLRNLKAGTYQLIAIKDKNDNYTYQPKQDKIAFYEEAIEIPTQQDFHLKIFKEILDFKLFRPKQIGRNHLVFPFEGIPDSTQLKVLTTTPNAYRYQIIQDQETDTLHYWFSPEITSDSMVVAVRQKNYIDTLVTKIRELAPDTLQIKALNEGAIGYDQAFELSANTPLTQINTGKINVIDKDSLPIAFRATYLPRYNKYAFDFEKEEKQQYQMTLLPGALTDMFEATNDTLTYRLSTNAYTDLGNLYITLNNLKTFPVIVQLTDNNGDIKEEIHHTSDQGNVFNFLNIAPGTYYIRIVYDQNDNQQWDTGNFLQHRQPEESFTFDEPIEIRANWDYTETLYLP